MISTIKNNLKFVLAIIFWIFVWQISAVLVDHSYFLPTVPQTLFALRDIIISKDFFKITLLTVLRVFAGLLLGTLFGGVLAVLSHKFGIVKTLVSPLMSIIKSTPVATVIIILWVMLSGDALSVLIAVLMVMPIIWQNLIDAYASISQELTEVCAVYEVPYFVKMKILVIPALIKYFIPGLITSVGLAWKSEIAAEIIAYTKNSIGQQINDAKYFFDTAAVFAWTLIVITLSILLEKLTKKLLSKFKIASVKENNNVT